MRRSIILVAGMSVALAAVLVVSGLDRSFGFAAQPTPKPSPTGPLPLPTPPGGPAPATVPSPTTGPGSQADLRRYTNTRGSWRVELPATWRIFASDDPAGAIITTFDPQIAGFQTGLDLRTRLGVVPRWELRIDVDVWPNPQGLSVTDWVDRTGAGRIDGEVKRLSRNSTSVAGRSAVSLVQQELSSDGKTRVIAYYVLASRDGTRIYIISMHPTDSLWLSGFQALLARFEVLQ